MADNAGNMENSEILIDEQVERLIFCRSFFPYLSAALVGARGFQTSPYYLANGLDLEFRFSSPITPEYLARVNDLGYWMNQNFVIRLYSLLECGGHIGGNKSIVWSRPGAQAVDIVRRLRNKIGHGSADVDAGSCDDQRLYNRIVEHFGLNPEVRVQPSATPARLPLQSCPADMDDAAPFFPLP